MMEDAKSQIETLDLQISDVECGIGINSNVSDAPTTLSSTITEFVYPYQINAKLMTFQDDALHATKDIDW